MVVEGNNKPHILDKTNYSSWASRMLFYIKGKEHGKVLVDSVLNGPFQYGTMVEARNETTPTMIKARTYIDLTDEENIHESVDIKATNTVFQDGRVIVQIVHGRQTQRYANNRARNTAINQGVNKQGHAGQSRAVKCYNYQEEGHFARYYTKPKRPKTSAWFKEKMLLTEALNLGSYLDLEQLAFLVDNDDTIIPAQAS
nr:hypothetical protein [Tanacetum cinerariifolium]